MDEKEGNLDQIEGFLRKMLEGLQLEPHKPAGVGRPRILPSMCLWAGVLVCTLRGWSSQLAIWRLLSQKGLWDYPRFAISDQAIYKRLGESDQTVLKWLFDLVSQELKERLSPYVQKELAPFATEVVAIDETSLDPIARTLPVLRQVPLGDRQLLPGKLAAIFDVRIQQWRHVEHAEDPTENEKVRARSLLKHIQPGALILADMGYFGFAWFDQLTREGYHWISRLRKKTSYEVIHTYHQQDETFDGLIWLGKYRADRAKYAVRLVTFRVGKVLHRYITNVFDPQQLSLHEIAQLYARRWDIEMAFKLIKRELGLHLFWSAKTTVILHQVWAVLIIAQILHALQMEIAGRAGVDPFDVSLHLLAEYLPRWNDIDFIALVLREGQRGGFIRPSRRIRIRTPDLDPCAYLPVPDDLVLERVPRYAGRKGFRYPVPDN
jgi:hypothetical protein